MYDPESQADSDAVEVGHGQFQVAKEVANHRNQVPPMTLSRVGHGKRERLHQWSQPLRPHGLSKYRGPEGSSDYRLPESRTLAKRFRKEEYEGLDLDPRPNTVLSYRKIVEHHGLLFQGPESGRGRLRRFLPVRRALISDIHGNLEALEVVLDDIKSQGITEIFCLGDIIGYGPNPRECIDRVMENCRVTLLGNHDQGAMFDPDGFNIGAERAIFWTREQLESSSDRENNERRWEFLGELPRTFRSDPFLFVHGSPRNPLSESIFPEDSYNHRKMERLFQLVDRYCFQGHTHVPGVFTEGFQFYAPEEIDNEYTMGDGKLMINVGSVGQPRDGDPRACYVILDDGKPASTANARAASADDVPTASGDSPAPGGSTDAAGPIRVSFRRLPYDFESTIRKIYSISELEPFLGDRLRQGR